MVTHLGFVCKKMASPVITQTVPLECTHRDLSLSGHTFRFRLQENELSSVITQTVPLECTHRDLSFEWSHLNVGFV